ncbi:ATP-binding cassette domain-containing protein [Pseudomonas tohonis]|uniref:ATP-binding cassette domain-containing protein n=1 Tax=Pseudomonas tohonis TaxID=2725477 RepID=UPI0021D9D0BE|nr:ATP-binding cassette domain-containing protein [Pseudomonas tohonis]UXY51851.1 ATP-binding cassette domain-containing protein [Pseudomonas tohonis]
MKFVKPFALLDLPPRALAFVRRCGASTSSIASMLALLLGKAAIDTLCALLVAILLGTLLPTGRTSSGWYAQVETHWSAIAGSSVSALPLLVVALVLGKGVLAPLLSAARSRLIDAWTLMISLSIFQHELTRPVAQLSNTTAQGSNVAVNHMAPRIVIGTLLPSLELLTESLVVALLLCVLLALEPMATAMLLGALLLAAGVGGALSVMLNDIRETRRGESQVLMQRWVVDSMASLREIHLYGRVQAVLDRYCPVAERFARATARERTLMEVQSPIMELFFLMLLVLCVLVASKGSGQTDLHALALFSAVGLRLLPGFRRVLSSLQTLRLSRPYFEELASPDSPTRTPAAPPQQHAAPACAPRQPVLLCEALQYRYPQASQAVIRDLNLSIGQGEWLGLVGESGVGKSTLVDVLIGELHPSQGSLQWLDLPAEHRTIGYAASGTTLIPGTLRDNLAFLGGGTEQVLSEALTIAGVDALLKRLPQGLDTPVEAFEQQLSSGERQRIGLARAVAHAQVLLILDEATAALDQLSESRFLQALRAARPELAVVLITHRLTALRHTDRNVLMADGTLTDFMCSPGLDPDIDITERSQSCI